ncbi:hypothetical protein ASC77_08890 [Nocardioides sp. Root1257]|uniref:hypothetical protein n=1 Tax=unclassified Nocardioides TaxID=2615069 RepID=UPI0006F5760E|nr:MULTISPECIES: hypothetical protein [unclassified Nocardioides]KQW48834.1 hypothetical protein ASC77_08890 [Nocardioides sp. Root1257]KRC48009.1 hypothetical protein ASE24_08895 [Nocardioides sp. Root224]
MYFIDALKVLLRRWYVVVIGMAVVGGLCVMTIKTVPTQYQASGQMIMLLPPDATGVETPSNPYLNLQPGLTTTAGLITGTVMSKDSARALAKEGFKSEYAVGLVPDNGPLLLVTTTDTDPAAAVATRDAVMHMLDVELAKIQRNAAVPGRQLITASPSNVGTRAEVLPGSKMRALVAVFALGVVITVVLAFVVDRLAAARRRRRRQRANGGGPLDDAPGVAKLVRREATEKVPDAEPEAEPEEGRRGRLRRDRKVGGGRRG